MRRRNGLLFSLAALAALWVSGSTISDDLDRITHPLRYLIQQTGGSTRQIELVVRDSLLDVDRTGVNLALFLEQNEFRKVTCGGAVAPQCYRLVAGWLVTTTVFVAIAPSKDQSEGWQLGDVRVWFTGP